MREQNEDNFRVEQLGEHEWLLVVCDGMGGHEAGEIASKVAVEAVVAGMRARDRQNPAQALFDTLHEANRAVLAEASQQGAWGMGTTVVAALLQGEHAWVGWVGDSRLYHFRQGLLEERTEDHTRVQQLVNLGFLTAEQAREHPDAHVLTQAIGGGPGGQASFHPGVWSEQVTMRVGDTLVLCSDGLHDLLDEVDIYNTVSGRPVQEAAEALVNEALRRGGHDNVTVIVAVYGQPNVPHAVIIPRPPPLTPASDAPTDPPAEPMSAPAAAEEASFSPPPAQSARGATPRVTLPQAQPQGWLPMRTAMIFVVTALFVGLTVGYLLGALVQRGETGARAEIVTPAPSPAVAADPAPTPPSPAPEGAAPPATPTTADATAA
ncbi:protein phosphatase 2C domain-containing protein, partial [Myxococcota bacterium]|nr:protein phosphatase 2C domain-containing protein [Myxococcota bacterium]